MSHEEEQTGRTKASLIRAFNEQAGFWGDEGMSDGECLDDLLGVLAEAGIGHCARCRKWTDTRLLKTMPAGQGAPHGVCPDCQARQSDGFTGRPNH